MITYLERRLICFFSKMGRVSSKVEKSMFFVQKKKNQCLREENEKKNLVEGINILR